MEKFYGISFEFQKPTLSFVFQNSKVCIAGTNKENFVPITTTLLDKNMLLNMLYILFKMKMIWHTVQQAVGKVILDTACILTEKTTETIEQTRLVTLLLYKL